MEDPVGLIGLGNMGGGIAASLLKKGRGLVAWDVDAAARSALDGAQILPPGEMAARVTTILFAVPASPQIEEVLGDILAAAKPGTILVDLTTSYPADTKNLAARAAAAGLAYLDAGMSGGAQGAAEGRLTLMIGGGEAIFETARPVLEDFTAKLFYMGPSGAGHTAKLLQNMVTHTIFLATCEAGRLGARAGIELPALIELFNASNARSFISERRFPDHILSDTWDGKSRVFNLHKDLGLAVRMAEELGLPAVYGAATHGLLDAAISRGMEDTDFTHLYEVFEDLD